MPYYNLSVVGGQELASIPAQSRAEALAIFGSELGIELTFEGDATAPYLLDEWEAGPHWVNPTIPVFEKPLSDW
jgi:hypothetical protein